MRELIKVAGVEFALHTQSVDSTTWHLLYTNGQRQPNHPLPAIIYETVFPWEPYGYIDMIHVNDLSYGEDDPVLVCCWDFYSLNEWWGKYQHCYNDATVQWYRMHGAWRGE